MQSKVALILLVALLLVTGCTSKILISSEVDPTREISKKDKVAIFLEEGSSISERKFQILLRDELEKSGFNIVETGQSIYLAKYVLFFNLAQNTSQIESTRKVLTTSKTKGTVGGVGGVKYKEETVSTKDVPYSYSYTVSGASLQLYSVNDFLNDKASVLWTGTFVAEEADYNKYPNACVKKLLEYFARDFKAYVPIDMDYK